MLVESVSISRRNFDAAIFDLDGVLTDTAGVHATAWKAVFRRSCRGGRKGVVWSFSRSISQLTTSTMSMGDHAPMAFEAFSPSGA